MREGALERVEKLIMSMGMLPDEIGLRKSFLHIDEHDTALLRDLHPKIADSRERYIDQLYLHLHTFDQSHSHLWDKDTILRLKQSHTRYFDSLTAGNYDWAYVQDRLRIGAVHQTIGLEPQWYLGTYCKYICDLLPELLQATQGDPEKYVATMRALIRMVFFDIGLTLDAYNHADRLGLAALKDKAELYASQMHEIMANVADSIVVIDELGIIESFNRAAETTFGYTAAEVIGRNVKMLMSEPDHSGHDGYLASYRATDKRVGMGMGLREVTGCTKDGKFFPLELAISEMHMGGRRIFVEVMRNIAARKQVDSEMRKLSSAIAQTADAVTITDARGIIEYVNTAFEEITGYSRDDAMGHKPGIVKSGFHDEAFYHRLWETIRQGEPFKDVFINRRKDGTLYYEQKTITPLIGADGGISHYVSTGKDITDVMMAEERLRYFVHHDIVTGLPNRASFTDRLKQSLVRSQVKNRPMTVGFLGLNRFKVINDTLGHHVGDRLLVEVAKRLLTCMREGDTIARWAGDEFAIVFEDIAGQDDVAPLVQDILAAFSQPFNINEEELFITACMGVSFYPLHGEDPNTLLRNTDAALARAKTAKGSNNYHFYTTDMNVKAMNRLSLETRLRRALEREEFILHYQPQVDLGHGGIVSVEALLRWQHPEKGLVSPLDFIPLLEETGLIVPVGEWVLRTACAQLRAWQEEGLPACRIAVNLSTNQVREPGMVDMVVASLSDYGIDAQTGCLELEITESLLMENMGENVAKLETLSEMGVALAIDDFGTGYSSLAYLKRLPIDTLKIDRSFINDITTDSDDAAIATAVIAMAHSLKLKVVAEGVETLEQLMFLDQYDCNAMQGYLFSKPLPAAEITSMIRENRRLVR